MSKSQESNINGVPINDVPIEQVPIEPVPIEQVPIKPVPINGGQLMKTEIKVWIHKWYQKIRDKKFKTFNKLTVLCILTLVISAVILHSLCQTNPNEYCEKAIPYFNYAVKIFGTTTNIDISSLFNLLSAELLDLHKSTFEEEKKKIDDIKAQISEESHKSKVLYIDCKEDDKILNTPLETIVEYAIRVRDENESGEVDKKAETYDAYCDSIKKKLGSGEPYELTFNRELNKEINVNAIVERSKNLLPYEDDSLVIKINQTADMAVETYLNMINGSHQRRVDQDVSLSGFTVVKVFQKADILKIIPCQIEVRGKIKTKQKEISRKKANRYLFFFTSYTIETEFEDYLSIEWYMKYKQMTFIMTKYDIEELIRSVKK